MKLSIIILNYKQKGLVKQCIKGIYQSKIRVPFEILVVDNHSEDGCLEMVREFYPEVRGISIDKNRGFAYGNNRGIEKSRGEYILILNPDIAIVEGAVEEMIRFLDHHPKVGIIGPKLIHPDGTIQYSCRRFPTILTPLYRRTFFGKLPFAKKHIASYLMKEWDHQEARDVDWLFAACILVRREALEKVGYFDDRFFLYYEDLDLCRRFWERGYEVWYLPKVELVHYHQRLSANRQGFFSLCYRPTRIHIISAIKYFLKYFGAKLPHISE